MSTESRPFDSEGLITVAGITVLTVPADHTARAWANVNNIHASTTTWFRAYKIPSGGSASTATEVIPYTNLASYTSHGCRQLIGNVLGESYTLVFVCGVASVLNVTGGFIRTLKQGA
jgi:hypothetical protein